MHALTQVRQNLLLEEKQAEAFYAFLGIPLVIKRGSQKTFRFGSQKAESIGVSQFMIPYADNRWIKVHLGVVGLDVPMLIGLDVMDKYKLIADNVDNKLICKKNDWNGGLTRKYGQIYYEWQYGVMYTELELKRIHRHFYHAHPELIYSLMKRAEDINLKEDTRKLLEKESKECEICQRIAE